MTYQTQPGTYAHRVVEYLRTLPPGTKLSAATIIEQTGISVKPGALKAFLHAPFQAGLLVSTPDPSDVRRIVIGLGDGVSLPVERDDEDLIEKVDPKPRKPKSKPIKEDVVGVDIDAPHRSRFAISEIPVKTEREPAMDVLGYERLADVLRRAYNQAALGKGRERHASGEPFHEQVMQIGARKFGTGALLFQAFKKSEESQRLPKDRAVAELLGAIVYLSGAVIALEDAAAGTVEA